MVRKLTHLEKADPPLQEALRTARDNETLCVILLLDTGIEPPEPEFPLQKFSSRQAWQQATAQAVTARVRNALAGTLAQLRDLGLDPQGWELGQAVVSGNPEIIASALNITGVKFAILDWELGLLDSLLVPLPELQGDVSDQDPSKASRKNLQSESRVESENPPLGKNDIRHRPRAQDVADPHKRTNEGKKERWHGISVELLAELECRLCRIRNRRTLFGGNDPRIVGNGPPGMVGKLVDTTYQWIRSSIEPREMLHKGDIARQVLKASGATELAKFLSGNQRNSRWVHLGRRILFFLLAGCTDLDKIEKLRKDQEAALRIDRYFFRGADKGQPKYFADKRATSSDAWSYRELAGEILALARDVNTREARGEVWYVSGGPDFFQGDEDDREAMLEAIISCLNSRVAVNVVYPEPAVAAAAGVALLRDRIESDSLRVFTQDSPSKSSIVSFFTPATRYLLLTNRQADYPDLWLLPNMPGPEDIVERRPRGYFCLREEVEMFQLWLRSLQDDLGPTFNEPPRKPQAIERHALPGNR